MVGQNLSWQGLRFSRQDLSWPTSLQTLALTIFSARDPITGRRLTNG
jgi:hypothetical protein